MNLRISIKDSVDPVLRGVVANLSGPGRTEMNRAAGAEVQHLTATHIAGLKSKPGPWGDRNKTNFYQLAAGKVAGPSALSAGPAEAILTINSPGFSRAFRNVTIVPKEARSLALPIHAAAFGFRAAELWDRMHLFIPKGSRFIAAVIGGQLTPMYLLCMRVVQKQDRSLLPSAKEFRAAAKKGAESYLASARKKGGKI